MKKLFSIDEMDRCSKIYQLLGYKEVKRKKSIFKGLFLLTYEKESEVKNYQVLRDRYAPHSTIPFFFVILFAALAIASATAYLFVHLLAKPENIMPYFLSLMLPTSLFTLIATVISFYRYFNAMKNIEKITAIPLLEKEVK